MDHRSGGSGKKVFESGHWIMGYSKPLLVEPAQLVRGVDDAVICSTSEEIRRLP